MYTIVLLKIGQDMTLTKTISKFEQWIVPTLCMCVHVLSTFFKLVAHLRMHIFNCSFVFFVSFRSVGLLSMFPQHGNPML